MCITILFILKMFIIFRRILIDLHRKINIQIFIKINKY